MKSLYYFTLAAASMMIFVTGCCTTPKPDDSVVLSNGKQEEIAVTVAADQTVKYQGKRMPIVDVPKVLKVKDPSKHILIYVYPQSKVQEETVKEFVKNLKIYGFTAEFMAGSKYSHLPIP